MAGFIILDINSPEKTWSSANWVYVGFLDHVMSMISTDKEVIHELTICKYHQNVDLGEMAEEKPEIYNRVIGAFILAFELIAKNDLLVSVDGRELDIESQKLYRQAISELAQFLEESNQIKSKKPKKNQGGSGYLKTNTNEHDKET